MSNTARKLARAKMKPEGRSTESKGKISQTAIQAPFGPCYLSQDLDDESEFSHLVTAVMTRRLSETTLVAALALVDRTCLGIKDAMVRRPIKQREFRSGFLRAFEEKTGQKFYKTDPLTVQSVVYHAIDYAARLGFRPHPDFREDLFGPRPDDLIETPLRNVEKPMFIAGPYDDSEAIIRQLEKAVGKDNFDFICPVF
ncbi:MAG: hypothetical protein MUC50_15465 [Myxococcota bacterium]|jgi:hypothetical protein|nr:hypothetical protein [Myxococcota bacterium]